MNAGKSPVKSADTMFRIVETVQELDGAGVQDVAEKHGMAKSTVHDHLKTLYRNEFLVKEGTEYHVGTRFLELGGRERNRNPLYQAARPELDELAAETGAIANLMVEEHGRGVFLYIARDSAAVDVDIVHYVGMRVPLQTTAAGKAILAHVPDERARQTIQDEPPHRTDNTVTDESELVADLGEIRERGYAVDDEERVKGIRCVAVPLRDADERVLGAISLTAPKGRMDGERFGAEVADRLKSSANIIEVDYLYNRT